MSDVPVFDLSGSGSLVCDYSGVSRGAVRTRRSSDLLPLTTSRKPFDEPIKNILICRWMVY